MPARKIRSLEQQLVRLIESGVLPRSTPHPCAYLADREACEEAFVFTDLEPLVYHRLMDLGFRRSGRVIYRPRCEGCARCVQLRIPVADFSPNKQQRRALRRLGGAVLAVTTPKLDAERLALYRRYLAHQHPGSPQSDSATALENFLYKSSVDTREIAYHSTTGELFAISIVDVCSRSLSSVYHYFDPAFAKFSPGVFSVVREIELAREWGIPYYYMGFWVDGCAKMEYKASYYPHEICVDGVWRRRERNAPSAHDEAVG